MLMLIKILAKRTNKQIKQNKQPAIMLLFSIILPPPNKEDEKAGGGRCLNPSPKHKLSIHCLVYMRPCSQGVFVSQTLKR